MWWAVGLCRQASRQLLDVVSSPTHEQVVRARLEAIDDVAGRRPPRLGARARAAQLHRLAGDLDAARRRLLQAGDARGAAGRASDDRDPSLLAMPRSDGRLIRCAGEPGGHATEWRAGRGRFRLVAAADGRGDPLVSIVELDFKTKQHRKLTLDEVRASMAAGQVRLDRRRHRADRRGAQAARASSSLCAPEIVEDALTREPATQIARYDDYIHLVLSGCRLAGHKFDLERVDAMMGEHFLLTLHRASRCSSRRCASRTSPTSCASRRARASCSTSCGIT